MLGHLAELDRVDDECNAGGGDYQTIKPGDLIGARLPFPPKTPQASEWRPGARKSRLLLLFTICGIGLTTVERKITASDSVSQIPADHARQLNSPS